MEPLYKISAAYREKVNDLLERGVDEQTIADTMDGEGLELQQKMETVSYAIKEMEAHITALTTAINEMTERRQKRLNRLESLKKYVLSCMKVAGIRKVDTAHFTVFRARHPVNVQINNAELIPSEYYIVPETPAPLIDRKKIRETLKSGKEVPGCVLVQDEGLRIK